MKTLVNLVFIAPSRGSKKFEISYAHRVLNASATPDGPVIRDFGLAIQEVAETIKRRNHLAGTVILVIKRGASPNLFGMFSLLVNCRKD